MHTSDNIYVNDWLKTVLSRVLSAEDYKSALKTISDSAVSRYPGVKIWFASRYGKRWSYLTGAGLDNFCEPEKIEYMEGYAVFIQNRTVIEGKDIEMMLTLFRITTFIFEYRRLSCYEQKPLEVTV